ncbi:MAG: hypothetical protein WD595_02950 [Waddliaceae bacterium]
MSKKNFFQANPKGVALVAASILFSITLITWEYQSHQFKPAKSISKEQIQLERKIDALQSKAKRLEKELNEAKLALWKIPAHQFLYKNQVNKHAVANLNRMLIEKDRTCQTLAKQLDTLTSSEQSQLAKISRLEGTVDALCDLTHAQKNSIQTMEQEHFASISEYQEAVSRLYASKKQLKEIIAKRTSKAELLSEEVEKLRLANAQEKAEKVKQTEAIQELLAALELDQLQIHALQRNLTTAESDMLAQIEFSQNMANELRKTGNQYQDLCQNCATLNDMLSFYSNQIERSEEENAIN